MNDDKNHEIGFIAGAIAVVILGCFLMKVLKELLVWLDQVFTAAAHTSYAFGLAALSFLETGLIVALFVGAIFATLYCLKKYMGLIRRVGDSDYELRNAYSDFTKEIRVAFNDQDEKRDMQISAIKRDLATLAEKVQAELSAKTTAEAKVSVEHKVTPTAQSNDEIDESQGQDETDIATIEEIYEGPETKEDSVTFTNVL